MNEFLTFLAHTFLRFHLSKIIGIGLFTTCLFFYRSYENRPILGLWSYPFFILIIVSTLLFLILLFNAWHTRKDKRRLGNANDSAILCFEFAILFWGIAYSFNVADNSTNAARVIELNFFGSIVPVAICLEWLSMVMLLMASFIFASSRINPNWDNILLVIGSIVTFMLLTEGILRVRAIVASRNQGIPTYNSQLWGRRYVKYNSAKFRDVEHSVSKNPQTRRLLVMGDSFAFGWGIQSIKDRFDFQLGKKIQAKTKVTWEVINISREDTHTLDHIQFLNQGLVYSPDVVILLYVFNDIDYLYPATPRGALPTFSATAMLLRNFYLVQEIYLRVRQIDGRYMNATSSKYDPYRDPSLVERHIGDLSTFVKLAEQNGANVRVVPFDVSLVVSDQSRHRYNNFMNALAAAKIPTWSLENAFNHLPYSRLVNNSEDGHPNEMANGIAAEEIAKQWLEDFDN